jgi:hypothetical protein
METESSLQNVVFEIENRMMDNVVFLTHLEVEILFASKILEMGPSDSHI